MGSYYIPPTMTVSGTAGSSLGQAANLASSFNQANQGSANTYNALGALSNFVSPGQTGGTGGSGATSGNYQDYLSKISGGQTDLPINVSKRNPVPYSLPKSGYPNTIWGHYQHAYDTAKAQNWGMLQQTLDYTEDAKARQLGEWNKYESANRADIGYELQNQFRNDMADINTRGFGGLVGKEFGLAGGPALGRLAEGASMASYHRANKMTEFNAEMAKARGDVFKWGGEQQRDTMTGADFEYPDIGKYMDYMKSSGGSGAYGSGQSFNQQMAGNTGAGFNLIGGQNTVLGQALMGGRGGGQRRDPQLAAKQQMNRQLQVAWDNGNMHEVLRLKKVGEDLGWAWGGGSGQG